MTGRSIRSSISYGFGAALAGLLVTFFVHLWADDPFGRYFVWFDGEPQGPALVAIYFVVGAVLRFLWIEAFALTLRGYANRSATNFNYEYRSAAAVGALVCAAPLLLYYALVLNIQCAAADRARHFGIQAAAGEGFFRDHLGDRLGPWPVIFWVVVLITGLAGSALGFITRADQRGEFRLAVGLAAATSGAFAGVVFAIWPWLAYILWVTGKIPLVGIPPKSLTQALDQAMLWGTCAAPFLGAGWSLYQTFSPTQRARAREALLAEPAPLSERLALLGHRLQLGGAMFGSIFSLAIGGAAAGIVWYVIYLVLPEYANIAALILGGLLLYALLIEVGQFAPQLLPGRPAPRLQPYDDD